MPIVIHLLEESYIEKWGGMFDRIIVLFKTINIEELQEFTVKYETLIDDINKLIQCFYPRKRKEIENLFMELLKEKLQFRNG